MKLKEFEIWAYELSLDDAKPIHRFSRCVLAHFERVFSPIDTDGVYRVIVKFTSDFNLAGTIEMSSAVLKYYKVFDIAEFKRLDLIQKKTSLLNVMYESLLELATQYSWSENHFTEAYQKVVAADLVNHYAQQVKWNRARNLQASIFCEHEPEFFRGSLVIVDKSNQVVLQEVLFEEEPDEFFFNSRLGKLSWLHNGALRFANNQGVKEFQVTNHDKQKSTG